MSNSLIRILIKMVMVAHGVGHTLGLFPAFGWTKSEVWAGQMGLSMPQRGMS
jgi:hypothetical protein